MNAETRVLTFEQTVAAPPAAVYYAFTNALALSEWLCNEAEADAVEGGRLYLHWTAGYYSSGEYTGLEPDGLVSFTWHGRGEPGQTRVKVALASHEDGTVVKLSHEGLGVGEAWDEAADWFRQGWERSLHNLVSVLEEGIDVRQHSRPMIGIAGGDEVTPELAADEGLPTDRGVRLADVVDGMAAKTAGLQTGDIVVRIGDRDVADWESLGKALAAHGVGDEVPVDFFRNADRITCLMTLTARPRPEKAPSPGALAERLQSVYDQLDGELVRLLEGLTEADASHVPESGGWTVRQVVAHLITTERAVHLWLAGVVSGQRLDYWASNDDAWVAAVDESYDSLLDLLDELRHCQAQTVSQVARVPCSFVSRKCSYLQAADLVLEGLPVHTRMHFAQICRALGREA